MVSNNNNDGSNDASVNVSNWNDVRFGLELGSKTVSYTLIGLTILLFIIYLFYSSFSWNFNIAKAQQGHKIYEDILSKYIKNDGHGDYLEKKDINKIQDSIDMFSNIARLVPVKLSNLENDPLNDKLEDTSSKKYYTLEKKATLKGLDKVSEYSSLNRNNVTAFCSARIPGYWERSLDNFVIRGNFGTAMSVNLAIWTIILLSVAIIALGVNQYFKFKRQRETQLFQKALRDKVNNEAGAAPVWELAQVVLSRYYDRNLNQNRMIFYVSVAVMVAGFSLILYGLSLTYKPAGSGLSTTVLSVGSGVIVQFIGATFLVIYNSTISQSAQYTNSLQRVSTIGTSIKLLDNIQASGTDDPATKDKLTEARIDIAKLLIKQAQESGSTPADASEKA